MNKRGWMTLVLIGVGVIGVGVAFFTIQAYVRARQHRQCAADAEEAVEAYLRERPSERLGDFVGLTGQSFEYPAFGSPGGFYLSAHRTAKYTKGTWEIRILVFPAEGKPISVTQLKSPDNTFNVEHPDLSP